MVDVDALSIRPAASTSASKGEGGFCPSVSFCECLFVSFFFGGGGLKHTYMHAEMYYRNLNVVPLWCLSDIEIEMMFVVLSAGRELAEGFVKAGRKSGTLRRTNSTSGFACVFRLHSPC